MKIYPKVARMTLAVLAVILVFSLAGCGGAATPPAAVDTVSVPTEAAEPAPPTSAPPTLPPPTSLPPSATPLSPTLPAPTATPPPVSTEPPPTETQANAPVPTLTNQPVDGVWTGGGTKLLIDFVIQTSNGATTLSNVGIVWQGHNECDLNGRFNLSAPLNENGFVMNYHSDELTFTLSGTPVSSTVIEGLLNLKVEDCGSQQIPWRAIPKTGSTP
jgi:hypothetical protein